MRPDTTVPLDGCAATPLNGLRLRTAALVCSASTAQHRSVTDERLSAAPPPPPSHRLHARLGMAADTAASLDRWALQRSWSQTTSTHAHFLSAAQRTQRRCGRRINFVHAGPSCGTLRHHWIDRHDKSSCSTPTAHRAPPAPCAQTRVGGAHCRRARGRCGFDGSRIRAHMRPSECVRCLK
jgi:hypothetical protein